MTSGPGGTMEELNLNWALGVLCRAEVVQGGVSPVSPGDVGVNIRARGIQGYWGQWAKHRQQDEGRWSGDSWGWGRRVHCEWDKASGHSETGPGATSGSPVPLCPQDLFSKSDPFLELFRTNEDGSEQLVYRTEAC